MSYKKIVGGLVLGALTTLVAGCSGGKLLSFLSMGSASCVKKDIEFDAKTQLKADIYYGKNSAACGQGRVDRPPLPTVVFIYGGSWKSGDKSEYAFVADAFTEQGYNVILPNYRLFPEVAYPKFVEDLASFMTWLADNASALDLSLDEIFLMGHSAGAYNASMYLVDKKYQKPFSFSGFVGLAGPYDYFLPSKDPEYIPVFSRVDKAFNSASELPVQQATKDLAGVVDSALLLHGADDTIVTPKNPQSFAAYLNARGVDVETKLYPGKGHISLVAGVSRVPFFSSEVKDDVLEFLKRH